MVERRGYLSKKRASRIKGMLKWWSNSENMAPNKLRVDLFEKYMRDNNANTPSYSHMKKELWTLSMVIGDSPVSHHNIPDYIPSSYHKDLENFAYSYDGGLLTDNELSFKDVDRAVKNFEKHMPELEVQRIKRFCSQNGQSVTSAQTAKIKEVLGWHRHLAQTWGKTHETHPSVAKLYAWNQMGNLLHNELKSLFKYTNPSMIRGQFNILLEHSLSKAKAIHEYEKAKQKVVDLKAHNPDMIPEDVRKAVDSWVLPNTRHTMVPKWYGRMAKEGVDSWLDKSAPSSLGHELVLDIGKHMKRADKLYSDAMEAYESLWWQLDNFDKKKEYKQLLFDF